MCMAISGRDMATKKKKRSAVLLVSDAESTHLGAKLAAAEAFITLASAALAYKSNRGGGNRTQSIPLLQT